MNSTNATFNLLPFDTSHEQNQSTITRMELLEFWNDRFGTPPEIFKDCLLYTSPSPRDPKTSRMPSSA